MEILESQGIWLLSFQALNARGKCVFSWLKKSGKVMESFCIPFLPCKISNKEFFTSFSFDLFQFAKAKCPNNLNSLHMYLSERSWKVMESLWQKVSECQRIHVGKSVETLLGRMSFYIELLIISLCLFCYQIWTWPVLSSIYWPSQVVWEIWSSSLHWPIVLIWPFVYWKTCSGIIWHSFLVWKLVLR